MRQRICPLVLALILAASVVTAAPKAPVPPTSPLDSIETLTGRVNVRGDGRSFVVTLTRRDGAGRMQFEIETGEQAGRPFAFSADNAEIHFWMGHLVVVAPSERKALHFSVEGIDRFVRSRPGGPQLDTTSALSELDTLLRANYRLTRIETASSIISKNEQALRLPPGLGQQLGETDTDYPDYGGSGGLGGCGSSCSTSCGDGSSCTATCNAPRCARCSCPASCSCS